MGNTEGLPKMFISYGDKEVLSEDIKGSFFFYLFLLVALITRAPH